MSSSLLLESFSISKMNRVYQWKLSPDAAFPPALDATKIFPPEAQNYRNQNKNIVFIRENYSTVENYLYYTCQ
jgi:hypothetical protein